MLPTARAVHNNSAGIRSSGVLRACEPSLEAWFRRARAKGNPELTPELAARYIDTQVASILVQMGIGIEPDRVREQARVAFRPLLA
ncbi:MAG: hypothetical protein AAF721_32655 [Myxococcota bacterium]